MYSNRGNKKSGLALIYAFLKKMKNVTYRNVVVTYYMGFTQKYVSFPPIRDDSREVKTKQDVRPISQFSNVLSLSLFKQQRQNELANNIGLREKLTILTKANSRGPKRCSNWPNFPNTRFCLAILKWHKHHSLSKAIGGPQRDNWAIWCWLLSFVGGKCTKQSGLLHQKLVGFMTCHDTRT